MKKLLSVATLLGALAGAASAAPYVLPSPQPGALTPYDWQPTYAIEGLYGIAQDSDLPDTYGVRGSFNLYNTGEGTFRHQFSVNVAATWGSDSTPLTTLGSGSSSSLSGQEADLDLFLLPVTLGYTLNVELTDNVMLYVGAKAGYAWSRAEVSTTVEDSSVSGDESAGGFTYSVGGGIKFQCSDSIYVHVGYEFGRSYLDYDINGKDAIYGAHTISLGIGCQF